MDTNILLNQTTNRDKVKILTIKAQNMITKIVNLGNFGMSRIIIVHKQISNNREEQNLLDIDNVDYYVSHLLKIMKRKIKNNLNDQISSTDYGRISVTIYLSFLSFGPASNVPKLTHYGVVQFHPRASAKATSRLWPYL